MRRNASCLHRSALVLVPLASAALLAFTACAEAPVDDFGGQVAETNQAQPGEGTKVPSPASSSSSDGGSAAPDASKDAGAQKDSSAPAPTPDAGSGSSSSSGGTPGACDENDPTYLIKAFSELNASSPRTCAILGGTCQATECCFNTYGVCVDK